MLTQLNRTLVGLHTEELSAEARTTLAAINGAVARLDALVERAASKDGVFTQAERATVAMGDVARNATGLGVEMELTLRAVKDAATSLQRLTDALERDSDMLIKGRAKKER